MFTNFPFFPQRASVQAGQVDAVFFFLVAVTAFFSLLIAASIVVFVIKYRRRHPDDVGVAIHGSLALEMLWTIIPLGIVMVMFGWGATVLGMVRIGAVATVVGFLGFLIVSLRRERAAAAGRT